MKFFSKLKKNNKFFIALVLVFVSLFFYGCIDVREELAKKTTITKLVYRPYVDNVIAGNVVGKTYREQLYDDLIDSAKNVLSTVVANYGLGEVKIDETSFGPQQAPNYGDLLNVSDYDQCKEDYEYTFSMFKYVYCGNFDDSNTENNFIVLSPNIISVSNLISWGSDKDDSSIKGFYARADLSNPECTININGDTTNSSSNKLESHKVYSFMQDDLNEAYIFLGGYLGLNSFKTYNEAKTYVQKMFSTDKDSVNKLISKNGISLVNNTWQELSFEGWKWKITEEEQKEKDVLDLLKSDQLLYVENYAKKYSIDLAVEMAKFSLIGNSKTFKDFFKTDMNIDEDLAFVDGQNLSGACQKYQIPCPSSSKIYLQDLYTNASKYDSKGMNISSLEDKKLFLLASCDFLDHSFLNGEETDFVNSFVIKNIIGLSSNFSDEIKQKYANSVNYALTFVNENHKVKPLLEYKDFYGSGFDVGNDRDLTASIVDGYLQSIIIISMADQNDVEIGMIMIGNEDSDCKSDIIMGYNYVSDNGSEKNEKIEVFQTFSNDELKTMNLLIEDVKGVKLIEYDSDFTTIGSDNALTSSKDRFVLNTEKVDGLSYCWRLGEKQGDYVEILFLTKNKFCKFQLSYMMLCR